MPKLSCGQSVNGKTKLMQSTRTAQHLMAKKASSLSAEEIMGSKKVLSETRKQIDAAYKRICGTVPARKSKARNNFLFGKKTND